jgi:hypothetical protein
MAETIKEPAAPLLSELCAKELLAKVLASETPDPAFINLEPGVRVHLFSRLKIEILQMKEVEIKWKQVNGMNPYIDTRIHLIPGRGSGDPFDDFPVINQWSYETDSADSEEEEEKKDDDDEDEEMTEKESSDGAVDDDDRSDSTEHDADGEPNEESTDVTETVVHLAEADSPMKDTEEPDFTRWTQNQLYSDSRGSDLKVCLHSDTFCAKCHPLDPESPSDPALSVSFIDRISSHLLYYRIVVTYAMPPSVEVQYPVCHWKMKLKHIDGISLLECKDSKGQAHVKFTGTAEASEDALGFLNYLTGEKCLHTYDGIIAGTVA